MSVKYKDNYGYAGMSCNINLDNGKVKLVPTENYTKEFLGGRGVGQSILFRELTPNVKPLDPENIMVFGTGPLTGTLAPISGRLSIDFKNALTGGVGFSNVGGYFGAELKYAGFDFIIIRGKASKPVYLNINNGEIEIRSASHLWGKTTWETEDILRDEDKRIQVLSIGPAGENLVKSACIIVKKKHAAGRCGIGAVMGSKNLKAIAVRGTKSIEVAEPEGFIKAVDKCWSMLDKNKSINERYRSHGTHINTERANDSCTVPYRNFKDDHIPEEKFQKVGQKVFEKWKKRNIAEFNSPIYMSNYYTMPEENLFTEGFEQNHAWDYIGRLDIDNPVHVLKTHILCNSLGLDIDNSSGVIAWAIDAFKDGLINKNDTEGLNLDWGDGEVIIDLLEKLAYRQGIGDLLAQGVKEAAQKIGTPAQKYAYHIKGQELAESIRSAKGWALGVVTATRGGGHLNGAPMTGFQKMPKKLSEERFDTPYAGDQKDYRGKANVVVWFEKLKAIVDMCGVGWHTSCWTDYNLCDEKNYKELINSCLGLNYTEKEIMLMGEKLHNLEKAFNTIHADFRREDDYPPEQFMEKEIKTGKFKGELLEKDKWDKMLDEYYELHNWDKETSWQTEKGLKELGMNEVLKKLSKYGKLIKGVK